MWPTRPFSGQRGFFLCAVFKLAGNRTASTRRLDPAASVLIRMHRRRYRMPCASIRSAAIPCAAIKTAGTAAARFFDSVNIACSPYAVVCPTEQSADRVEFFTPRRLTQAFELPVLKAECRLSKSSAAEHDMAEFLQRRCHLGRALRRSVGGCGLGILGHNEATGPLRPLGYRLCTI